MMRSPPRRRLRGLRLGFGFRPRRASGGWYDAAAYDLMAAGADFNGNQYFLPTSGTELITNGTFDTDTTGWTLNFNGTMTWNAGRLRITSDGGASAPRAVQALTGLTIGKVYAFTADVIGTQTSQIFITTSSTGTIGGVVAQDATSAATRSAKLYFIATATTLYAVLMQNAVGAALFTEFDNVSVKEVILAPTGRVYGAELVLNGDFSAAATGNPATGWALKTPSVGTETMTISGGTLNLTGDGTNPAYADQSFATVNGGVYELTFTVSGNQLGTVAVGTAQGGSQLLLFNNTGTGTLTLKFIATGTTSWLRLTKGTASLATVDNVSLKQITIFGRYLKRSATFAEWFAYTASSTAARTYMDATGVMKSDLAANAPRLTYANGKRQLRLEDARTNLLLNSGTLSTQSVAVTAAAHTLSFYGTGTVTLSGVATDGPLVGTGATSRVTLTFTPTVGTLTLTVTGSVTSAQLELGAFASDYIPTTTVAVTRAIETARFSPLMEAILQRAAGSVVVRAQQMQGTSARLVGYTANGSFLQVSNATTLRSFATGSAVGFNATAGSGSMDGAFGAATGFDAAGRALVLNGGTVTTDANVEGTRPDIYLGRDGSNTAPGFAGYYDFVGVSPERLTNAQLQALAVAA